MANLLFKKGSYDEFKSKILDKNAATEGALYFTENEGSLYLGVADGKVQRIQGTVHQYATLTDFAASITPPYSTDVIYFIADKNALVRWDAAANEGNGAWVQLNTSAAEAQKLQTSITEIAGKVAVAEGQIATNKSDIASLTTRVGANETAIAGKAAQADLEALEGRVEANEGAIKTINEEMAKKASADDLSALSGQVATNKSDIAGLDTRVGANETAIAGKASQADLNGLATRVGANETAIASKASTEDLNKVKTTAEDAAALAGTNKTDITNLTTVVNGKAEQSALNEVSGKVGTLETNLSNLSDTVDTKASQEDLNNLTNRVSTAEGTLGTHTGQISTLQADLNAANTAISGKADKTTVTALTNTVNGKVDKSEFEPVSQQVTTNKNDISDLKSQVANKVEKVDGKGLSSNDFTDDLYNKLVKIEAEANKIIVDSTLDANSSNPVENKVIASKLSTIEGTLNDQSQVLAALDTTYVKQATYNTDKAAIDKEIADLKTALGTGTEESIGTRLSNLEKDNETNKTDIGTLKTGVGDLQTALGTTNSNVSNLSTKVDGIEGRVQSLEGDNTTNKNDIAALKTKTDNTNTALGELATRVTTAESDIDDIQALLPTYATKTEVEKVKTDLQKEIDDDIKAANAMTYEGKAEKASDLPTSGVHVGDTYVISGEGFNNYQPGDILIAQGTEVDGAIDPDTLVWDHITTGYSSVHNPELVAENNQIVLKDYAGNPLGAASIVSASNNIAVATESNSITLTLQWDTF